MELIEERISRAAALIRRASHLTAFTGAGISVESGIPPFRGENGLWNKVDPKFIDIGYFYEHPLEAWELIRQIFYDSFGKAVPNAAHVGLSQLEKSGYLKSVITQNIDNLHQIAGSERVFEFHGNSRMLVCSDCGYRVPASDRLLASLPPYCSQCDFLLKPDFVFFGEAIPEAAQNGSFQETTASDLMLVIGTTGEVMPAAMLPIAAKRQGATIIEINLDASNYTHQVTDLFLKGKATEVVSQLVEKILDISDDNLGSDE